MEVTYLAQIQDLRLHHCLFVRFLLELSMLLGTNVNTTTGTEILLI